MTKMDIRTPDGALIRPAPFSVDLTDGFLSGAMPWWLSATAGTATFLTPPTAAGGVRLTTGAVSGNAATLSCGLVLQPTLYHCIEWGVDGLFFDVATPVVDFLFRIYTSSSGPKGAHLSQKYNETVASIVTEVASTPIALTVRNGEGLQRRNLRVRLFPKAKEAHIMENDRVVGKVDIATLTNVNLTPDIAIITRENVAHSFSIAQAYLKLWRY